MKYLPTYHPSRLNGEDDHYTYPLPPLPVPPVGLLWTFQELVAPAAVCQLLDLTEGLEP